MVNDGTGARNRRSLAGRVSFAGVAAVGVAAMLIGSAAGVAGAAGRGTGRPTAALAARIERKVPDVAGEPIPFGTARSFGGLPTKDLRSPVVAIASSHDGQGYWLVSANGTVFKFGDAHHYGSASAKQLGVHHIVAMAATPDGKGYWLLADDGALFKFGDAHVYGSASGKKLHQHVLAMAVTPDGKGYWLVTSDGAVFKFGDAHLYSSGPVKHLRGHVVAMATTPGGLGYWLVSSDGAVFKYGDAHRFGSATGKDIVAMASTPSGKGYWLVASDGAVYRRGNAGPYGSAFAVGLKDPIAAAAAVPGGTGYWLLPTNPPPLIGLPPPGKGFVFGHVTAIGDSVMLDAQPDLVADIPRIDVEAEVSRQWDEGVALAQELKSEDRLGAIVIIDLGTNGPVTPDQFTNMMNVLAGASRVVFVTIHLPSSYSWWQSVNATLESGVPKYAVDRLADFNKLADENPQWFGPDGIHMPIGGAGAQAMAKLIKSKI
jgi:hypothetical protein